MRDNTDKTKISFRWNVGICWKRVNETWIKFYLEFANQRTTELQVIFFKGLQEFLPDYQGTSVSWWITSRRQVQALIWLKYSVWDAVELSAVWLKFLVLNHKQFLLFQLIPKGLLQQWTLSKWAHYQSVHPINTPSAICAWAEGSESKLNKELQCSWN